MLAFHAIVNGSRSTRFWGERAFKINTFKKPGRTFMSGLFYPACGSVIEASFGDACEDIIYPLFVTNKKSSTS